MSAVATNAHSLKGVREQFRKVGKFHTPPQLALYLASFIPASPRDVYDPTCGAGSLLSVFAPEIPKYGQDIDTTAIQDARTSLGESFTGVEGDVLTDPQWAGRGFHAIVANPPFSITWEPRKHDPRWLDAPTIPTKGRADFAFLLHIMAFLAPDGTAAVLQAPGVCFRGGREAVLRRWFTENNWLDKVIAIPGNTFTDTSIPTVVLVLRKNRTAAEPVTFINKDTGTTSTHTAASLLNEEGCSWAANLWNPEPQPEPTPVDPLSIEHAAQDALCRRVFASLGATHLASSLDAQTPGMADTTARFVASLLSTISDAIRPKGDDSKASDSRCTHLSCIDCRNEPVIRRAWELSQELTRTQGTTDPAALSALIKGLDEKINALHQALADIDGLDHYTRETVNESRLYVTELADKIDHLRQRLHNTSEEAVR